MMDNQDIDIKNLEFSSEDTGYFLTKSYSEYKWKFILDGISREISLYHSKILGRRTIYLGDRKICLYQRYTYNFRYSFTIDVHTISIIQSDDTYILKIDGIPSNKLLNEQKLSRFNIIREMFEDKNDKNKNLKIKPLMTYKGGRGNIVISNRTDSRRDIYKTSIISGKRENDIENDKNIINTSSKRSNNTIDTNMNSDYYYNDYNNNYYEESSENLSNKAIDGGDSQRDEDDEEEQGNDNDNNNKENNLDDDLFKIQNNIFENGNNEDLEEEEIKEEKLDEDDNDDNKDNKNNINNIENKDDSSDSSEEEDEKEKEENNENKINEFNDITNELMPIKSSDNKNKSNKNNNSNNNKKIPKIKIEKKIKKKNNNYNYDEDDIYNINNENNNIDNGNNNINNENHIDLLGEEIYNSSRDKDYNNINNNFNINYYISQQKV